MKKLILLALAAVMMAGCYDQKDVAASIEDGDFAVFEFDSCEYLIRISSCRGYLAHKGNCRFCKKRMQKELEELVIRIKEK